jgi:hypothetical protein
MPALERLEVLLASLENCAKEHLGLLQAHRQDLLENRPVEIRRGVEVMEALTERMRELEAVRQETCQELGDLLNLPWLSRPWNLDDLMPALPCGAAQRLRESGSRLKASLLEGAEIARGNAVLAQAGERLANDAMAALKRLAIGHQRAPAAYGRRGTTNVRPALSVLSSVEWRG